MQAGPLSRDEAATGFAPAVGLQGQGFASPVSSATRPRRPIRRTLVAPLATLPLVELPAWWDEEPDDLARYLRATAERDALDQAVGRMTDLRALAVLRLNLSGMSYGKIAEATGVTPARIQQLVGRGRRLGEDQKGQP